MTAPVKRTAIVLFNLGGPDGPDAIRPFLFNLFNDPAIIGLPAPLRLLLAQFLSRRRARTAAGIYAHLGGGSPLLANTEAQAAALEAELAEENETVRVFIAMRYWHPMSDETAVLVKDFNPDRIVLLPLYPQLSGTTSTSSMKAWRRACKAAGLDRPTVAVCCYPTEPGLVSAMAGLVKAGLDAASAHGRPRVLFSAHGLPKSVVKAGDPYAWQCEQTAAAVAAATGVRGLDWTLCYQSRVGPLEWIGPATEAEIRRAGADKVPVVVVPIAFVSEHSETLVELDIEYRHVAEASGVPHYIRVPAVGTDPAFIRGLARLVRRALVADAGTREGEAPGLTSQAGGRICPGQCRRCPQKDEAASAAA